MKSKYSVIFNIRPEIHKSWFWLLLFGVSEVPYFFYISLTIIPIPNHAVSDY